MNPTSGKKPKSPLKMKATDFPSPERKASDAGEYVEICQDFAACTKPPVSTVLAKICLSLCISAIMVVTKVTYPRLFGDGHRELTVPCEIL